MSDEPKAQELPVNMWETSDAVVIVTPAVGVMPDDISVEVEDGVVRIDIAQRSPAEKPYKVNEWNYGPFTRALSIPPGFGRTAIATLGNGQLAVSLQRGTPDGRVSVQPRAVTESAQPETLTER